MLSPKKMRQTVREIFIKRGGQPYASEPVTQLQHAIQSAMLAEEEEAPPHLIVAAFLHDIGHILSAHEVPQGNYHNLDDAHEIKGYHWLMDCFGASIAEPIRLHVSAKRYLCSTETGYFDTLTPTSKQSFEEQGGYMDAEEIRLFEQNPFANEAIALRRWDDRAKDPTKQLLPLDRYLSLMGECLRMN
jgi:phosphonate degradation associated HDIG domain protein